MRFDIVKLHYLSPQRVISTSSLADAFVQLIDKIVDVPVVMQRHVPRSWTSVVMLTGACDLGVRTVTAFTGPVHCQTVRFSSYDTTPSTNHQDSTRLDRVVRRRVWKILERCSQGGVYRRQCPCWEATLSIDRPDRAEVSGSPSDQYPEQVLDVLVVTQQP